MSITIAALWREGRDLAESHAATAVPVAAAFMFLPQVLRAVIAAPPATQSDIGGGDVVASLIVVALAFIGQATIAAIMLGGRDGPYNVADSLRRAAGLLPRLLLIVLMLAIAALPLVFVLGVVAVLVMGPDKVGDAKNLSQTAGLLFVPVIAVFAYVGARLFPLFPVLVAETPSARGALRRSWQLTRPSPWTFVGFTLSALLAIMFLTTLITMVAGGLLGLLLGSGSSLGQLLTLTFATLAGTAIGVIIIGASVAAYRGLASESV